MIFHRFLYALVCLPKGWRSLRHHGDSAAELLTLQIFKRGDQETQAQKPHEKNGDLKIEGPARPEDGESFHQVTVWI